MLNDIDEATMAALTDGDTGQGHLKAGFLGFPKCGKTFTATLLAIACKRRFKLQGPIAMFDTEVGSVYVAPIVKALTGEELLCKKARSFDSMMTWARACVKVGAAAGIVDSVTHPWRELCDSFLKQVNAERASKGWGQIDRIQFEHWNILKPRWGLWTDFYLNSPMHLLIAGRAGWEYEMEVNDRGKKELVKTGTKMKTESEFGFEPSLLVEVERQEKQFGNAMEWVRTATVLGDRFSVIDGKVCDFRSVNADNLQELERALAAVDKFFGPHLDRLTPGIHASLDTQAQSKFNIQDGEDEWAREKRQRTILAEEIQGELVAKWPSQSAEDKKAKAEMIFRTFNTRSWAKVESMKSDKLREGLDRIRVELGTSTPPAQEPEQTPTREAGDDTPAETPAQ